MNIEAFALLSAIFTFAFILVGYEADARRAGVTVGKWFLSGSPVHMLSIITCASVLIVSFMRYSWWSPAPIFITSLFLGPIIVSALGSKAAFVSLIGMVAAWATYIINYNTL